MPLPVTPTRLTLLNDTFNGTTEDNWVQALGGDDLVSGGDGNDRIEGGDGDDTLNGGDGNDTLAGGTGLNTMIGGAGADTIYGRLGVPFGVAGDTIIGGSGYDTLVLTTGGDHDFAAVSEIERIIGSNDSDFINLTTYWSGTRTQPLDPNQTAPTDPASANGVTMLLRGGNDYVTATIYADTIGGGDGNDWINGHSGNDRIGGDAGDDVIDGGAGNDTLSGGWGNDTLIGGDGDDYFVSADGHDEIIGGAGRDTVSFIGQYSNYKSSFEINFYDRSEIKIGGNSLKGIEVLSFTDRVITLDRPNFITGSTLINGTFAGDRIVGSANADSILGLDGNDDISGGAGNDTLYGGDGNDHLRGGDGNDTLFHALSPPLDSSSYYGQRYTGIDTLDGGAGDDLFVIELYESGHWDLLPIIANGGDGLDTLRFKDGTLNQVGRYDVSGVTGIEYFLGATNGGQIDFSKSATAITFTSRAGQSAYEIITGTAFADTFVAWGSGTYYGGDGDDKFDATYGVRLLDGGNGNDQFVASLTGQSTGIVNGGAGYDELTLTYGGTHDTRHMASIERVNGSADSDFLDFHSYWSGVIKLQNWGQRGPADPTAPFGILVDARDGNDWVYGTIYADTLMGGTGNDTLDGGGGDDRLNGDDGDDQINGGAGNDTIYGGVGTDVLLGGVGNDTLVVDLSGHSSAVALIGGDGYDTVELIVGDRSLVSLSAASLNGIEFIRGSAARDDINLTAYDANPTLSAGPVTDLRMTHGIAIDGDAGDDIIYATAFADHLIGGTGNDYLDGGAGNDTLTGGSGQNSYVGGAGDDTIYANLVHSGTPTGQQVDAAVGGSGYDTLVLTTGGPQDFSSVGEIERIVGTNDIETLDLTAYWSAKPYNASGPGPTDPAAAFGVTMLLRGGNDRVQATLYADAIGGGDGNDFIEGQSGNDRIGGDAGNDTIDGGTGNDTINGGSGSDFIYGGDGDDRYFSGAGQDYFNGDAGRDIASFTGTYSSFDAVQYQDGSAVVQSTSDIYDRDILIGVEVITFADRVITLDRPNLVTGSGSINGTFAGDRIVGSAGADTIDGRSGRDDINAGAGDDLVYGDAHDLCLHGGDGYDQLRTTFFASPTTPIITGFESILASDNPEIIDVSSNLSSHASAITTYLGVYTETFGQGGNDRIIGGVINEHLAGGTGNDELYGNGGNDVLTGQDGDDLLFGGDGIDAALYFDRVQSQITISRNVDGTYTATDAATGAIDTLSGIEQVMFSDHVRIAIDSLVF